MMLEGVPRRFVGDGGGDASVQDSVRIEKFGRERKVNRNAIGMEFGNM